MDLQDDTKRYRRIYVRCTLYLLYMRASTHLYHQRFVKLKAQGVLKPSLTLMQ